jgi:hypothetical protein
MFGIARLNTLAKALAAADVIPVLTVTSGTPQFRYLFNASAAATYEIIRINSSGLDFTFTAGTGIYAGADIYMIGAGGNGGNVVSTSIGIAGSGGGGAYLSNTNYALTSGSYTAIAGAAGGSVGFDSTLNKSDSSIQLVAGGGGSGGDVTAGGNVTAGNSAGISNGGGGGSGASSTIPSASSSGSGFLGGNGGDGVASATASLRSVGGGGGGGSIINGTPTSGSNGGNGSGGTGGAGGAGGSIAAGVVNNTALAYGVGGGGGGGNTGGASTSAAGRNTAGAGTAGAIVGGGGSGGLNTATGTARNGGTGGAGTIYLRLKKPLFTVTYIDTAESNTSSITIPSTAQVGDLAVLYDFAVTTGTVAPTSVTPSGWTKISVSDVSLTTTPAMRGTIHWKFLVSGDPGSTITGMAGGTTNDKIITIHRPSITGLVPASGLFAGSLLTSGTVSATTPANLTVFTAGGNVFGMTNMPFVIGVQHCSTTAIASTSSTQTPTRTINNSSGRQRIVIFENTDGQSNFAANSTCGMTDGGNNLQNAINGFLF